jgi:hypothetical protein
MNSYCEPGHKKIDALRSIVASLKTIPAMYAFNDTCVKLLTRDIPAPYGGTRLSVALNKIKADGHRKAIIVTDGEVDHYDQELSLNLAKEIELKVLYVGVGDEPEFLKKLAKLSGGFCTKEDLTKPKELEMKLAGLIEAPKSGVIEL